MARLRTSNLLFLLLLAVLGGCTRLPSVDIAALRPKTLSELQDYLLSHQPDVDVFRSQGPFAVTVRKDQELRVSASERIRADVYLAAPAEKAPLVILLHGYDATKADHAGQAMHLASWGLHTVAIQLPSKGPWVTHGRTLARSVALIARSPETIDSRVDVRKIILVGHSFGGSAVAIALADGARAMGGILLDPATIGRDLPSLLRRISKPVLVLGADDEIAWARNRDYFYEYIRSDVAELSIKDATHEDAQWRAETALRHVGADTHSDAGQSAFVSALTAAALSLAATGSFDYAWSTYGPAFDNGKFFNAKKK